MHPYRNAPMPSRTQPRVDPEDLVLYGLLVFIGVIPVIVAFAEGAVFGFDATLGLLMVAVGVVGTLVELLRARWQR